jgi:hypothetical protein
MPSIIADHMAMAQKIHFKDDAFFFSVMVKALSDGLAIDIDQELYGEKVATEIRYLEAFSSRFLNLLETNEHLVERLDHLKHLYSSIRQFRDILEIAIARAHPVLDEEGKRIAGITIVRLREQADRIHELLVASGEEPEEADVVSHDELSELLK